MVSNVDAILHGRIHLVQYERVIEDIEGEVRRMLAYLNLPYDPACLRFHENSRPVDTPSSEQVRRPINRDGLSRWRNYEPWLAPLQKEPGPLADSNRSDMRRGGKTGVERCNSRWST